MKQFIRYLYEYEQGKRVRNVGFVRVEQTEEATLVHIHGKGLRIAGNRQLGLYLFYETDKECVGIPQGILENVNPAVNYRLRFTREDTGAPENYARIDGVILEADGGRRYAAVWDDMPVDVNGMKVWEETPEEVAPEPEEASVEGQEKPVSGQSRRCSGRRIQRKDLAELPRCEWRWSNNSFLLHGYYNYRHLLLIEDGEQLKLGVPGIYHEKEANAARALGFGEFIPAERISDLPAQEDQEEEEFGYWCVPVRR